MATGTRDRVEPPLNELRSRNVHRGAGSPVAVEGGPILRTGPGPTGKHETAEVTDVARKSVRHGARDCNGGSDRHIRHSNQRAA